MDAITLLKSDHRSVEKLFKQFEKAGERAHATKAKLVAAMIRELSVHAAIEEQAFYPAARRAVSHTNAMVLESLEEHHIVKWLLSELEGMDPTDERFEAKVTVLIEQVRNHVEEEERDLFPQVEKGLGETRLAEVGEALEGAKRTAPTRPHPRSADTPPANLVTGLVAGAMDLARDVVKGVTSRR
ncbi:MAG TPA: hemerythrin domain-containing protein [Acidimicrobiales bacterium]|jgi:hemerythrin superfamily protein|nr:hemerythrin domain-containing protein [Acidimicrobiales bacterium]